MGNKCQLEVFADWLDTRTPKPSTSEPNCRLEGLNGKLAPTPGLMQLVSMVVQRAAPFGPQNVNHSELIPTQSTAERQGEN